jgi:ubiquinone/menaquinone biosynthesis C-methylase UbiE
MIVDALAQLVAGDRAAARRAAEAADGLLADALARYLAGGDRDSVYDQPAAFAAFIRGGGNVGLYAALTTALAGSYDAEHPDTLLDIGCGDGTALVPALSAARHQPAEVHLVEPSAALLAAARDRLADAGVSGVCPWPGTVQDFAAGLADDATFDVVESTFAMHTLPHAERTDLLARLRPHVGRLAVAEFDVPNLPHAGPEHLRFLADTYERGIAEYDTDRELVAQGFMLPVLTGQLAPGAVRATWEQPAREWRRQLTEAGYTDVATTPLHDYWWSPAFLLTARGDA